MGKKIICPFCKKELKKGLFSNEIDFIELYDECHIIECCSQCAIDYAEMVRNYVDDQYFRFQTKYENGWLDFETDDNYQLLCKYIYEYKLYKEKRSSQISEKKKDFYHYNSDGYFWVEETEKSADPTLYDNYSNFNAALHYDENVCFAFNKSDISRIEFTVDPIVTGAIYEAGTDIFRFLIRFNDEKVMTYKPCLVEAAIRVPHAVFARNKSKKAAIEEMHRKLVEFKHNIGSDLPINYLEKF